MAAMLTTPKGVAGTHHMPELRETQLSGQSRHEDFPAPVVPSSSPLSEEETDNESVLSLSGPTGVAQSAAEKAREKKLRDDPMATVLGPLYVDCKRCGTRIKLSSKSPYDTCHWRTHRARCLKRQPGIPKKQRLISESVSPSRRSEESPPPQTDRAFTPTPPLTTDNEQKDINKNSHSSSLSPSRLARTYTADAVFEDYLLRSNRKKIRYTPPKSHLHWQDWSWDQLLLPQFVNSPNYDQQGLSIADNPTDSRNDTAVLNPVLPHPS